MKLKKNNSEQSSASDTQKIIQMENKIKGAL